MFENLDIIRFIIAALVSAPLFIVILSGPIAEWLNAREDRKKAAAEAKAESAAGTASPSASPA